MIRLRKILTNWVALAIYVAAIVLFLPLTSYLAFWGVLVTFAILSVVMKKWGGRILMRFGDACPRWVEHLARFCRYIYLMQLRGKIVAHATKTRHRCLSCGSDFVGNYCPYCGQSGSVKQRIHFGGLLKQVVLSLMKFGSGMGRTIIDLLWRPGFMIRDYLQGRRVCYASPFLTLVFMLVLFAFVRTDMRIEQKTRIIPFYVMGSTITIVQDYENIDFNAEQETRTYVETRTDEGVTRRDSTYSKFSSDSTISKMKTTVDNASQRWTVTHKLWKTAKGTIVSHRNLLRTIGYLFLPLIIIFALLFRKQTVGGRRLDIAEYFVVLCYLVSSMFLAYLLLYFTANSNLGLLPSCLLVLIVSIRQLFDGFTWSKAMLYAMLIAGVFIFLVLAFLVLMVMYLEL